MKTYVFIDAANIIYRPTDQDYWKIDLKKLYTYLRNRFEADRILYYAGVESKDKKQRLFYDKLEEWGYELRLNSVKYFYNDEGKKYKKADVDSRMTFDMMSLSKVVAGDFANLDNLRFQLELKETDSTNDSVSGIT